MNNSKYAGGVLPPTRADQTLMQKSCANAVRLAGVIESAAADVDALPGDSAALRSAVRCLTWAAAILQSELLWCSDADAEEKKSSRAGRIVEIMDGF